MKIHITTLRCKRCEHKWVPSKRDIRMCPKCKTAYWDTPRRSRQGLRPEKKAS